jgi:hypothetical protein
MQLCRSCTLISLGLLLTAIPPSAQEQKRTYQSFNADVPFNFSVGERKFHAGHYEFIVSGAGLMIMRDARAHVLATLLTRDLAGKERDVAPRFIFEIKNGHNRLSSIWMEKGKQGYEILGEEIAMRQAQRAPQPILFIPPVSQLPTLLH